jgi:hypothetical protein
MPRASLLLVLAMAIGLFAALLAIQQARAVITATVTPTGVGNNVAGLANAQYDVSFTTGVTNNATSVTVTFPAGYGVAGAATVQDAVGNAVKLTAGGANNIAAVVTTGGNSVTVTFAATNLSTGVTAFRILTGVTNPTTAGVTGSFTVSSNAAGESGGSSGGITIVAAAANKYVVSSNNYSPAPNQTITITAQLTDAFGNPVSTAALVVTWGKNTVSGAFLALTSPTDANGRATVGFTVSAVGGTVHTVTATEGARTGTSSNITVGNIGYRYNVTASSYNPAPGTSVVIYAQLVDINGFPVAAAGRLVTWSENSFFVVGVFFPSVSMTDANGLATTTYTTPISGVITRYVTATDNFGITGTSAAITTYGPIPSAVFSTITASPSIVNANGVDYATVVVTLYNNFGQPLPGKTVQLNRTSGSAFVSTSTGVTNFAGVVIFTVTNTVAQTVTFSAIDLTDGVSLNQTATVTFIGALPTATPTNTPVPVSTVPPAPQGTPGVTSLIASAPAGSRSLAVSHTVGFVAGDVVRINAGASNQEDVLLIATGPLTLNTPLQFNHAPGEVVTRLFFQGVQPPQQPPPPIRPPAPQPPNAGGGFVGQVGGWPTVLIALLALTGAGLMSATAGGLGRRSVAVRSSSGAPAGPSEAPGGATKLLAAASRLVRRALRRR